MTFGQNRYLLEALNSHGVEYLIVGGLAVKYYVPDHDVDDLDILLNPTIENAEKVIEALTSLRLSFTFSAVDLARPKVQIPLKQVHYADLVTPEAGFDFASALFASAQSSINGIGVRIASKEHLITLKDGVRGKDRSDVQLLKSSA